MDHVTGLTDQEAAARRRQGQGNTAAAGGGRSAWAIIRSNVFTVFNNIRSRWASP